MSILLSILSRFWKPALILSAILVILYSAYHMGYTKCAEEDAVVHHAAVVAMNEQISNIEADSVVSGQKLYEKNKALEAKIADIISKGPVTIYVHDKSGNKVLCNDKQLEVFLGQDFISQWNLLNVEANK
jgi:hypothetical protein